MAHLRGRRREARIPPRPRRGDRLDVDGHVRLEHRGVTLLSVAVANLENDDALHLVLPFDRHGEMALGG
jgi:hypothetical protein